MAETIYVGRSLVIASANPIKSANVTIGTGSITSNLTSGSLIVTSPLRAPTLPLYTEAATQPSVASGGDEWFATSNSNLYQYSSGIWNLMVSLAPPVLYTFSNAWFNTGGATGRNGPTISQARSGLTGTPAPSAWYNTYLNMTTQGYQLWTVPATGTYTIEIAGAQGTGTYGGYTGGLGVVVRMTVQLNSGAVIGIVVGQQGVGPTSTGSNAGGAGGGGSFVWKNANQELIGAAGGGGGAANWGGNGNNGANSGYSTSGTPAIYSTGGGSSAVGTNGNGGGYTGGYSRQSGSGGGWLTGGTGASGVTTGGNPGGGGTYSSNFIGGNNYNGTYWSADGGFGGGGGGYDTVGGGGGGYSGGPSGYYTGIGVGAAAQGGGGGGSYLTGTSQVNVGTNIGAGYVTIAAGTVPMTGMYSSYTTLSLNGLTATYFTDTNVPYMNSSLGRLNQFIKAVWTYGLYAGRMYTPAVAVLQPYPTHSYYFVSAWEDAWWTYATTAQDILIIAFDAPRYVTSVEVYNSQSYSNSPPGTLNVSIVSGFPNALTSVYQGQLTLNSNTGLMSSLAINTTATMMAFTRTNGDNVWSRLESIFIN